MPAKNTPPKNAKPWPSFRIHSWESFILTLGKWFFCGSLSLTMLTGVVQLGLRWESTLIGFSATLTTKGGASYIGHLTQNWSGDYVIISMGEKAPITVTPVEVATLTLSQTPGSPSSQGAPWRLIAALFAGLLLSAATALAVLQAFNSIED